MGVTVMGVTVMGRIICMEAYVEPTPEVTASRQIAWDAVALEPASLWRCAPPENGTERREHIEKHRNTKKTERRRERRREDARPRKRQGEARRGAENIERDEERRETQREAHTPRKEREEH